MAVGTCGFGVPLIPSQLDWRQSTSARNTTSHFSIRSFLRRFGATTANQVFSASCGSYPHTSTFSLHAESELAGHRLLDHAVRNVPGDARDQEW